MGSVSYKFGPYELDTLSGRLTKFGTRIPLQQQPQSILLALVERPGEIVTREELRKRLWLGDIYVDFEHSLNRSVNRLRQALCDAAAEPVFIETIAGRGYRFIAEVETNTAPDPESQEAVLVAVASEDRAGSGARRWRVALAITALVLITAGLLAAWRLRPRQSAGRMVVVILPVVNLTGQSDDEYLADGVTETLIAELSRLSPDNLAVIARTSAMKYKNTRLSIREIGRDLHADYVLESSIRRSGGRIRFTAHFIRASDETHVWAQDFERAETDPLDFETEIGAAVARTMQIAIPGRKQRPVDNADAVRDYYQGRFFLEKRNPEDVQLSIEYFKAAVRKAPNFAKAYAGLADAYLISLGQSVGQTDKLLALGSEALNEALRLDPNLTEARTTAALMHLQRGELRQAAAAYEDVLRTDPNYVDALYGYGLALQEMNRLAESTAVFRRAIELDPLSMRVLANGSQAFAEAGDFETALSLLKRALAVDEGSQLAHGNLLWVFLKKHDYDSALKEIESITALLEPKRKDKMIPLAAFCMARLGRTQEATKILRELEARSRTEKGLEGAIVIVYAGLGNAAQTIRWSKQQSGFEQITYDDLRRNPVFDPVRSDLAFIAFAEEVRARNPHRY